MIGNLFKVIVYVQDMEKQVRFYRDVLGLTIKFPAGLDDYSEQYWVEFETGECSFVLHGGGAERPASLPMSFAFAVDAIEQVREKLIASGAKMGEVRSPAPNVYVCDGIDPEGNKFSVDSHL